MFVDVSKKKPDPAEVGPLATEILRLRKKANLTQPQLAARAEVSRQTISNLENGAYEDPEVKTLKKIARPLGTTAEALMRIADGGARTPSTASEPLTTLAGGQRRPPGLDKWLCRRAGILEVELGGLMRYRSRPGDTAKDMESDAFWDRELEYVRESIREVAAQMAGDAGRAEGRDDSAAKRMQPGKSRH